MYLSGYIFGEPPFPILLLMPKPNESCSVPYTAMVAKAGFHLENFVRGERWVWHLYVQHIAFLLSLSAIIFSSTPTTNNIASFKLHISPSLFLSLSLSLSLSLPSPLSFLLFWGGGGSCGVWEGRGAFPPSPPPPPDETL